MKCPVCTDAVLQMAERHGIEIDYCPNCRGIWLDRGELDKIIEKTPETSPPPSRESSREGYDYQKRQGYKKKKSSFLSDLFDF